MGDPHRLSLPGSREMLDWPAFSISLALMTKTTRDAIEILDWLTGDDSELREMIAEERVQAQVERTIHEARRAAGLTSVTSRPGGAKE
jgi:hypothetical protein